MAFFVNHLGLEQQRNTYPNSVVFHITVAYLLWYYGSNISIESIEKRKKKNNTYFYLLKKYLIYFLMKFIT